MRPSDWICEHSYGAKSLQAAQELHGKTRRNDLYPEGIKAQRLKRVFNIDIETCRHCQGPVKIIACIEDPVVIEKILSHLRIKAQPQTELPLLPPARAPPVPGLFGEGTHIA